MNPILYNVMSRRYRQAFKETLCCCFVQKFSAYQKSLMSHQNYSKVSKGPQMSTFRKHSPEWRQSNSEYTIVKNGHIRDSLTREPSTPLGHISEDPLTKLISEQMNYENSNGDCRQVCPTCTGNICSDRKHAFTTVTAGNPHQTELLELNNKQDNTKSALKECKNGSCV